MNPIPYPSDLTDAQWTILGPLLPQVCSARCSGPLAVR